MKKPLPLIPFTTLLLVICINLNAQTPSPLIHLNMNATSGVVNYGTTQATFNRSANTPVNSTNVPANAGGTYALDFGTQPGNYFVESTASINTLRNMSAFTISGWINCTSNVAGSGGNRIVSWINNGGDGVDLVYQSNGSLRIGVDGWPDNSPAFSSPSKVPTNPSAPASNWVFFAVTYRSSGQVEFYFGSQAVDAALDVTRTYAAGNTGNSIANLAIGAFNVNTRIPQTYDRMFRGLIDNVLIHDVALSPAQIVGIQRGNDITAPFAPINLWTNSLSTNSVTLTWPPAIDDVGVTGYELFSGTTLLRTFGTETSHVLTGLTPGTTYSLTIKARDAAGNRSPSSHAAVFTTYPDGIESQTPPLIWLKLDYFTLGTTSDDGSSVGNFRVMGPVPSTNVPLNVGGPRSVEFGATPSTICVESPGEIEQLKNLDAFTLTGWVNSRSNVAGSGGNRIISWINNGGDGVDLVYQSNGSLRLGVDEWPDASPAFSSPGKVPTNAAAPVSNWIFFAVTYQSSGVVQFYFGDNSTDATLDVSRAYTRGVTGSNIAKLAIGHFNDATRNAGTMDRMFRGLIDDIRVHTAVLSPQNIVDVQRKGSVDATPPTTPTNLAVSFIGNTSAGLTWNGSTDNYDNFNGAGVVAYDIYNGAAVLGTSRVYFAAPPASLQLVGLIPNTSYTLTVRARDAAGNLSAPSNAVQLTTGPSTALEPLIHLAFDEPPTEAPIVNAGIVSARFRRAVSSVSDNVPQLAGNVHSIDGSLTQELPILDPLKNLGAFTLTGWLNARAGGNVLSWQRFNGEGVNLQVDETGSLVLHIDQLVSEASPAKSSAAKVTVNPSVPASNWVFFAVTYQSNGQASFYFGNNTSDATLDMVTTLPAAGRTGTDIEYFHMGYAVKRDIRGVSFSDNFFNGLIDDVHVFASALSLNEILSLQRQSNDVDVEEPTAPSNVRVVSTTASSATLTWTASNDNVGVTGYEILGNSSNTLRAAVGPVTTYTMTNLEPSSIYTLKIVALDASFNRSDPTVFKVRTNNTSIAPLIQLHLDNNVDNTGSLPAAFVRSSPIPYSTSNAHSGEAMDFDVNPGNNFIESTAVIDGLKSLNAFTITGWINNRSNAAGSGGNRIVSWINNGGDGVDLVYQSNGSLRVGIDGWPDSSPAVSSADKVSTDFSMSTANWVFFAATYSAAGEVKFYFGNLTQNATLDVTRAYTSPGVTGSNIGKLAIGNFNSSTRNSSTWDRMFKGVIDEIQIFNSVLTLDEITALQRVPQSYIGRLASANPAPRVKEPSEVVPGIEQNRPNPYNVETEIQIALPHSVTVARLLVYDATGRVIRNVPVVERGEFTVHMNRSDMGAGIYLYSLIADGKVIGTRRMAIID